ncbi:MAG: CDP-diacylglycerol--serine O-phosphatidyltransferase [Leptospiraceae bacterium]|nr:MAG: CDP-diacylglycerol--serine O-phosphatidyltransferase [Leptospiraceae bacterium]
MIDALKNSLKWIPNLFTLGNLWLGFYATLIALQSHSNSEYIKISSILIILAALLDGLDGFIARLLNATSEIGAQLDSLADLTTFGIAPGALFYMIFLQDLYWEWLNIRIPLGMILAGLYPAAVAFRLARFNVSHSDDSFDGLPSPIGGLIVALMPLILYEVQIKVPDFIFIIIYIFSAYLMVSTIKYSKVQVSLFRKFSTIRVIILLSFIFLVLIGIYIKFGLDATATAIFILLLLYIISGIIAFVIHLIQIYRL